MKTLINLLCLLVFIQIAGCKKEDNPQPNQTSTITTYEGKYIDTTNGNTIYIVNINTTIYLDSLGYNTPYRMLVNVNGSSLTIPDGTYGPPVGTNVWTKGQGVFQGNKLTLNWITNTTTWSTSYNAIFIKI